MDNKCNKIGYSSKDIWSRNDMAKKVSMEKQKMFTKMNLELKKRIIKCWV